MVKGMQEAMHFWLQRGVDGFRCDIEADKRVGIGYASKEDQDRLWRFKIK